jgi:UDP-2,3-diacylglucosamine pyrophosphatase LpxH
MFDSNNVRSLFISDVHLGSRNAQTGKLLEFLSEIKDHSPPEKFYIVGDFIDGWKLKRNWYWDDQCSLVIRKILSLLRRDTEIFYIAGNHDEFLRSFMTEFNLLSFGSIQFGDEFIHETADGQRILVVHGDKFDLATKYARWLCVLGDIGYEALITMNTFVHWCQKKLHLPQWSLSKSVKRQVKKAVNYIGHFEDILTKYALDRQCDGVMCGHIHTPAIKEIGGVQYFNTGDWVETCSAIIEDTEGNLSLHFHNVS